ncbi:16675_t:CDS:2 [Racocetra persica]|uniref:16675_t:CDS:1 n=1 Tax=Racocetra persica TaxID=160502 RepID=A0ACA9M2Z2_9GLOM|nr:16675_t:CDS:2 [Racocetra persica]
MDASIIASFKLHYCHLKLQHAIDLDEAGKRDIYKVDQLQSEQEVHQQFTDEDFVQGTTEIEQEEEEMVDNGGATLKSLRKIQSHIHEEVRRKQNKKQIQYTLDHFFKLVSSNLENSQFLLCL